MGIRKFIIKFLIFAVISLPILTFKNLYLYYTGLYKSYVAGPEIYRSLEKSKMKKKAKKLLIGDSVGNQLYNSKQYNDTIFSLTSNKAISMVGQYILLSNFIKTNKDNLPSEVIVLMTPESFSNNLDENFSYHYFLKPFYYKENEPYFDVLCTTQIRKIPYYYSCAIPFIRSSDWSPEYTAEKDTTYKFISPISNDYLLKIKELCLVNNIKFNISPTPVKSSNYKTVVEYSKAAEIMQTTLRNDLKNYFSNIVYMPDELFRDHNHFKDQNIPVDFLKLKS